MMKASRIFAAAALMALALLSVGCKKHSWQSGVGTPVQFRVESGSTASKADTKTAYSGNNIAVGESTYDRLDWISGDKIAIFMAYEDSESYSILDYRVGSPTADGRKSQAPVSAVGQAHTWQGEGNHFFGAVYPSPSVKAQSETWQNVLDIYNPLLTYPATQILTPKGSTGADALTLLPDMDYAYMFSLSPFNSVEDGPVTLSFIPVFTAFEVEISAGENESLDLTGFKLVSHNDDEPVACVKNIYTDEITNGSQEVSVDLTGTTLEQNGAPLVLTVFATGGYVPDFTGWHELEVRVADGYGEKGPKGGTSGTHPWSVEMGIGWRDDGITNAIPESAWHKFMDSGDGSLFRVEANMTLEELIPDSYMIVTNVVLCADSGGVIPASCCKGCAALVDVAIPSDVSRIGDEAFSGCTNLDRVILPQNVGRLKVGMNALDAATAIEIEERDGYVFCGWTNATGNVVADPFHSVTANTVTPWWKKTVTIAYDANGGSGTMADQMALDGDDLPLASNAFVRVGYQFVGWATTANGSVEFTDGQTVENVGAVADGAVLYAVWKPSAPSLTPSVDTIFPNASQTFSATLRHGFVRDSLPDHT